MSTETAWRSSSYSSEATNCVEVAQLGGRVAARDSKDRSGPALSFARPAWTAFVAALHSGEFDHR